MTMKVMYTIRELADAMGMTRPRAFGLLKKIVEIHYIGHRYYVYLSDLEQVSPELVASIITKQSMRDP